MKGLILTAVTVILVSEQLVNCIVIDTPSGSLKGAASSNADGVYKFLGIPFAETPVRFEKAVQKLSWAGTRDATFYRDECLQLNYYANTVHGSEDCLTLDVYTPVNVSNVNVSDSANQVAVMVWIHIGGSVEGASSLYEGSRLANYGNVVVVAIQYRLGAFGWLYSYGTKPSNIGLWDQRLALEWIQRNIYAFGGDKSRVTVFGESAGSRCISALVTSPVMNNTLFQRAIMQSGSLLNGDPLQHIRDVAINGLSRICPNQSLADKIVCLQEADAVDVARNMFAPALSPFPDNQFVMESASKVLRDFATDGIDSIRDAVGNMQQYDILNGFSGQEGFLLLNALQRVQSLILDDGITQDEYDSIVTTQIESITPNKSGSAQTLASYLQGNYNTVQSGDRSQEDNNLNNLLDLLGDLSYAVPTINTATIHAESVRATGTQKKTFLYLFDHKPANGSRLAVGPDWLQTSSSHTDDIRFILSYNNASQRYYLTPEEEILSEIMMRYWTNFAKTGNPNSDGEDKWKEFSKETTNFVRFTLDKVTAETAPREGKREIFDCVYKAVYDNNPDLCQQQTSSTPSTATTSNAAPSLLPAFIFVASVAACSW